eukprot:s5144_g2.t1
MDVIARFLFDGKTSVDIPFDPFANPTGSFAVECWAVCTAATGHQCLLSSRDQTSGKAGVGTFLVVHCY